VVDFRSLSLWRNYVAHCSVPRGRQHVRVDYGSHFTAPIRPPEHFPSSTFAAPKASPPSYLGPGDDRDISPLRSPRDLDPPSLPQPTIKLTCPRRPSVALQSWPVYNRPGHHNPRFGTNIEAFGPDRAWSRRPGSASAAPFVHHEARTCVTYVALGRELSTYEGRTSWVRHGAGRASWLDRTRLVKPLHGSSGRG